MINDIKKDYDSNRVDSRIGESIGKSSCRDEKENLGDCSRDEFTEKMDLLLENPNMGGQLGNDEDLDQTMRKESRYKAEERFTFTKNKGCKIHKDICISLSNKSIKELFIYDKLVGFWDFNRWLYFIKDLLRGIDMEHYIKQAFAAVSKRNLYEGDTIICPHTESMISYALKNSVSDDIIDYINKRVGDNRTNNVLFIAYIIEYFGIITTEGELISTADRLELKGDDYKSFLYELRRLKYNYEILGLDPNEGKLHQIVYRQNKDKMPINLSWWMVEQDIGLNCFEKYLEHTMRYGDEEKRFYIRAVSKRKRYKPRKKKCFRCYKVGHLAMDCAFEINEFKQANSRIERDGHLKNGLLDNHIEAKNEQSFNATEHNSHDRMVTETLDEILSEGSIFDDDRHNSHNPTVTKPLEEVLNEKSIFDDEFSLITQKNYTKEISVRNLNHDIDDMTFVTSTLDSNTIIGGEFTETNGIKVNDNNMILGGEVVKPNTIKVNDYNMILGGECVKTKIMDIEEVNKGEVVKPNTIKVNDYNMILGGECVKTNIMDVEEVNKSNIINIVKVAKTNAIEARDIQLEMLESDVTGRKPVKHAIT
ncbi:hypothetical protein, partial [Enterobacter mori]